MSQKDLILAHLRAGRVLNPLQALKLFNCWRLSARVYDLRLSGWDVQTRRLTTRSGKIVALYHMRPQ